MPNKIFRSLELISLLVLFLASACTKSEDKAYEAAEQTNIQNYLISNPTMFLEQKASGLYYTSLVSGFGNTIGPHDTAYLRYVGKFLNGTVFSATTGKDTFKVVMGTQTLIQGLEEAVSYMREGGKSICLIPSRLAYGKTGRPPLIPGYTPLIFEVSLPRIEKGLQK